MASIILELQRRVVPHNLFQLLALLGTYEEQKCTDWPSIAQMAHEVDRAIGTVSNQLHQLRALGWLTVVCPATRLRPTVYSLNINRIPERSAFRGAVIEPVNAEKAEAVIESVTQAEKAEAVIEPVEPRESPTQSNPVTTLRQSGKLTLLDQSRILSGNVAARPEYPTPSNFDAAMYPQANSPILEHYGLSHLITGFKGFRLEWKNETIEGIRHLSRTWPTPLRMNGDIITFLGRRFSDLSPSGDSGSTVWYKAAEMLRTAYEEGDRILNKDRLTDSQDAVYSASKQAQDDAEAARTKELLDDALSAQSDGRPISAYGRKLLDQHYENQKIAV